MYVVIYVMYIVIYVIYFVIYVCSRLIICKAKEDNIDLKRQKSAILWT